MVSLKVLLVTTVLCLQSLVSSKIIRRSRSADEGDTTITLPSLETFPTVGTEILISDITEKEFGPDTTTVSSEEDNNDTYTALVPGSRPGFWFDSTRRKKPSTLLKPDARRNSLFPTKASTTTTTIAVTTTETTTAHPTTTASSTTLQSIIPLSTTEAVRSQNIFKPRTRTKSTKKPLLDRLRTTSITETTEKIEDITKTPPVTEFETDNNLELVTTEPSRTIKSQNVFRARKRIRSTKKPPVERILTSSTTNLPDDYEESTKISTEDDLLESIINSDFNKTSSYKLGRRPFDNFGRKSTKSPRLTWSKPITPITVAIPTLRTTLVPRIKDFQRLTNISRTSSPFRRASKPTTERPKVSWTRSNRIYKTRTTTPIPPTSTETLSEDTLPTSTTESSIFDLSSTRNHHHKQSQIETENDLTNDNSDANDDVEIFGTGYPHYTTGKYDKLTTTQPYMFKSKEKFRFLTRWKAMSNSTTEVSQAFRDELNNEEIANKESDSKIFHKFELDRDFYELTTSFPSSQIGIHKEHSNAKNHFQSPLSEDFKHNDQMLKPMKENHNAKIIKNERGSTQWSAEDVESERWSTETDEPALFPPSWIPTRHSWHRITTVLPQLKTKTSSENYTSKELKLTSGAKNQATKTVSNSFKNSLVTKPAPQLSSHPVSLKPTKSANLKKSETLSKPSKNINRNQTYKPESLTHKPGPKRDPDLEIRSKSPDSTKKDIANTFAIKFSENYQVMNHGRPLSFDDIIPPFTFPEMIFNTSSNVYYQPGSDFIGYPDYTHGSIKAFPYGTQNIQTPPNFAAITGHGYHSPGFDDIPPEMVKDVVNAKKWTVVGNGGQEGWSLLGEDGIEEWRIYNTNGKWTVMNIDGAIMPFQIPQEDSVPSVSLFPDPSAQIPPETVVSKVVGVKEKENNQKRDPKIWTLEEDYKKWRSQFQDEGTSQLGLWQTVNSEADGSEYGYNVGNGYWNPEGQMYAEVDNYGPGIEFANTREDAVAALKEVLANNGRWQVSNPQISSWLNSGYREKIDTTVDGKEKFKSSSDSKIGNKRQESISRVINTRRKGEDDSIHQDLKKFKVNPVNAEAKERDYDISDPNKASLIIARNQNGSRGISRSKPSHLLMHIRDGSKIDALLNRLEGAKMGSNGKAIVNLTRLLKLIKHNRNATTFLTVKDKKDVHFNSSVELHDHHDDESILDDYNLSPLKEIKITSSVQGSDLDQRNHGGHARLDNKFNEGSSETRLDANKSTKLQQIIEDDHENLSSGEIHGKAKTIEIEAKVNEPVVYQGGTSVRFAHRKRSKKHPKRRQRHRVRQQTTYNRSDVEISDVYAETSRHITSPFSSIEQSKPSQTLQHRSEPSMESHRPLPIVITTETVGSDKSIKNRKVVVIDYAGDEDQRSTRIWNLLLGTLRPARKIPTYKRPDDDVVIILKQ